MHAGELIELAGHLVQVSRSIIASRQGPSLEAVQEHWIAARCRLDRWTRLVRHWSAATVRPGMGEPLAARHDPAEVVQEILASEVLTRTWAAICTAQERVHGGDVIEPISLSLVAGHADARSQALQMLLYGPGLGAEAAVQLNDLRRRCERWIDLAVGIVSAECDVTEFALRPARAAEYARLTRLRLRGREGTRWIVGLMNWRAMFPPGLAPADPCADLNRRVAASIAACLPAAGHRASGALAPGWLASLVTPPDETPAAIEAVEAWRSWLLNEGGAERRWPTRS